MIESIILSGINNDAVKLYGNIHKNLNTKYFIQEFNDGQD